MSDGGTVYAAICGAGRALGYVCAPSLFQRIVAECQGQTADLCIYMKNRNLLYNSLQKFGYRCIHPDRVFCNLKFFMAVRAGVVNDVHFL